MTENNIDYVLVNAFNIKSKRLDSIIRANIYSPEALLQGLAHACQHLAPRTFVHKARRFYRGLSRTLFGDSWQHLAGLGPGDTLFVPGAYWLALEIMRFYRAASAKGIKLVVLLYDVLPITHPHLMVANSDQFFGPILELPIHVVTISNATKSELGRAAQLFSGARIPISVDVVTLAHEFPGAERNQPPGDESGRLKSMIGSRNFALSVSTVEVRKNHLRLIQVWNKLASELGEALPLLVIAGKKGWEAEEAIALLDAANERHKAGGREPVIFIEGPSDAELQWLYPSCDFTVFPSIAEGWGLPVGESLWFGKTCAASHTTSIPEVGGELCLYFDPEQPSEIEAAIKKLLDPVLRAAYESKIQLASLRTWKGAGRDIAMAVIAHASNKSLALPEVKEGSVFRAPSSVS